jgi:hypothetical protein
MSDGIIATYYIYTTNLEADGRYSVDYKTGLIHTATKPLNGYTITYNYTKYQISYPVARALSSDEYTVDVNRNIITINTEKLINENIAFSYPFNAATDASLSELTEYYTPIVKDIRWRILLEGI